jgi:EAL domain-containing protein (putative c-di-GMP-specific phosphodiesterase class I)
MLLLGADQQFAADVADEASRLGVGRVVSVSTAREALELLCSSTLFSHLILHYETQGEALRDLLSLTAGEPESGVTVAFVGGGSGDLRGIPGWQRVMVVRQPDAAWLALLASGGRVGPPPPAGPLPLPEVLAALDEGRLSAHFQPLVEMGSGRPIGIEALARLDHAAFGVLGPEHFVPSLEQAGHALRLAERIAQQAFSEIEREKLSLGTIILGLNLPLQVLRLPCIVERLETWRGFCSLPPERITIELTETFPVTEPEQLRPVLKRMRAAGYRLAIDDVGASTPNYEALLSLPFAVVKLDKHLVQASGSDTAALDLARHMVDLAHRRGCRVIAEGIEAAADWERMAHIGVDVAQGFLVARPMTARMTAFWLADWRRRQQPRHG